MTILITYHLNNRLYEQTRFLRKTVFSNDGSDDMGDGFIHVCSI